jgi:hypothetical protein
LLTDSQSASLNLSAAVFLVELRIQFDSVELQLEGRPFLQRDPSSSSSMNESVGVSSPQPLASLWLGNLCGIFWQECAAEERLELKLESLAALLLWVAENVGEFPPCDVSGGSGLCSSLPNDSS